MGVAWHHPSDFLPPHRITHFEKFLELVSKFQNDGWDPLQPALLGYDDQLITGSHRWAAARKANILIPVIVYSRRFIEEVWGTDDWLSMIRSPPNAGRFGR